MQCTVVRCMGSIYRGSSCTIFFYRHVKMGEAQFCYLSQEERFLKELTLVSYLISSSL